MKKVKEKNVRILEGFCVLTVALTGIFCILYVLGIMPDPWFLDVILGFGVLLHAALFLLSAVRRRYFWAAAAAVLALFYAVCLVFFIL